MPRPPSWLYIVLSTTNILEEPHTSISVACVIRSTRTRGGMRLFLGILLSFVVGSFALYESGSPVQLVDTRELKKLKEKHPFVLVGE